MKLKSKFFFKIIIFLVSLFIIWVMMIITDMTRVKNGKYPFFCNRYIRDTSGNSQNLTAYCLGYRIDCNIDYWKIVSNLRVGDKKILTVQYDIEH